MTGKLLSGELPPLSRLPTEPLRQIEGRGWPQRALSVHVERNADTGLARYVVIQHGPQNFVLNADDWLLILRWLSEANHPDLLP